MQGPWKLSTFLKTSRKVKRLKNQHCLVREGGKNACPHSRRHRQVNKGSHVLPEKRKPWELVPW